MSGPARSAVTRCASEGKVILEDALAALENEARPELAEATRNLAKSLSGLAVLAQEAPPSEEYSTIRGAVQSLSAALGLMQAVRPGGAVDVALEAVARTLALLYPLARGHQRRRRSVVLDMDRELDSFPGAAPAPTPRGEPEEQSPFHGRDKRSGGNRVHLEVDIGLMSQSHFYTGLSRDLSRGGVFVATYQAQPAGTSVELTFVLPGGRAIHTVGVVRWTSGASGELPPGMGIAFENLNDQDLAAVQQFCETRDPLYHDAADD